MQATAGEFSNQETADHSSQSIILSADIKMNNWTAAEIQEMLGARYKVSVSVTTLLAN